MFRGRLGGPLTVLHPESVTTTPLSTIWNNAFFTAAPFSFFPFLLFPFPFSFFFSFFLFSAPFSSFSFLPFTSFVHNLQSRSFEITYLHFSRIGSIFFILYQFLLCLMDVAKKVVIFLFSFSLFPSRICIGRAWLFFSYRLTSFSPLFLIWNKKCLIYPFPPNRQPQTWRFFVFYPQAFSIIANLLYQMYISRVPQLTCIWMSGASGLGNLTTIHLIRKKWY